MSISNNSKIQKSIKFRHIFTTILRDTCWLMKQTKGIGTESTLVREMEIQILGIGWLRQSLLMLHRMYTE